MINLLKNIGIIGIFIAGLITFGIIINTLLPWIWLTYFFIIVQDYGNLFNWCIDMTTIWQICGLSLAILIGIWSFKGMLVVINYLKNN